MRKGRRTESILGRDVLLIMTAAFFYMGSSMLVTPIIVGYSHHLGANGEMAGLVAGAMNTVSLFLRPVAGTAADRISKRRMVGFGACCLIAANVWYACASSPTALLFARIVNGVGFSCVSVCLATWLTSLIPLEHIGKGMGYYGMVNALAMAVGPALGIKVQQMAGYRGSCVVSTVMAVLMAVIVMLVRDGGAPRPAATATSPANPPTSTKHGFRAVLDAIVSVRAIPVTLIFMLFAIPYCATQSYIVTYVHARSLAVETSLFFPCYAVALLVLRMAMRNLFDRLSFAWFLAACSLCMAGTLLALAVMRGDVVMMVAALCMAGSYGLMNSVAQSSAVRLGGAGHSGQANATFYIGLDLGMALGPMIGGMLYARVDIQWFFPVMLVVVPLAVIVYLAFGRRAERAAMWSAL
ncbi:MFS transporter [Bifidobacterium sp. 82T24]|uniref:MFS transporter n=1 Tax=Bifidobacterium pluvialisilvae TaxID=2834436 RepID=UPI001C58627B|nr:MFS transporter [Bifidobacterium pluvialisilvae]MBW3088225.1 MFS transporter [Bifidobacterium pluvialisilvae]